MAVNSFLDWLSKSNNVRCFIWEQIKEQYKKKKKTILPVSKFPKQIPLKKNVAWLLVDGGGEERGASAVKSSPVNEW